MILSMFLDTIYDYFVLIVSPSPPTPSPKPTGSWSVSRSNQPFILDPRTGCKLLTPLCCINPTKEKNPVLVSHLLWMRGTALGLFHPYLQGLLESEITRCASNNVMWEAISFSWDYAIGCSLFLNDRWWSTILLCLMVVVLSRSHSEVAKMSWH